MRAPAPAGLPAGPGLLGFDPGGALLTAVPGGDYNPDMQRRALGRTGLELSLLGFGGFHLVEVTRGEASWLLNTYLDRGGNYIETAAQYGDGISERKIGEAVSHRRSEFVLATKTGKRTRAEALASLERSLANLRTDHVDLFFMHEPQTVAEARAILAPGGAMEAFAEAKRAGKARFVAVSGHGRPAGILHSVQNHPYDVLMTGFNYLDRFNYPQLEGELLPLCQAKGVGVLGMKALGDGYLHRDPATAIRYTLSLPIASLVIGIILAYLQRTDKESYKKTVWMGVAFGLGLSVLTAILFNVFAGGFEGRAEELFEGVTMLIGVALLTTMILWMMRQRRIAEHIHSKVDTHLAKDAIFSHLGLFFLAMIAVLREGVETVIFLNAVRYSSGLSLIGGLLGVAVAIGLGWLFFYESRKINLKKLFTFSSVLLILFAAGLVAHGVHELEEAKVLDPLISPLYSINGVVNENSVLGSFLKGLFGYNGNPSLLEALSYWVYLGAVGVMWKRASTA